MVPGVACGSTAEADDQMSITLIKQIRADRDPRLTAPLKFTLMTVATYHSEKSPESGTYVGNSRLAEDMGVDIRTVQRHLIALSKMGKILVADTSHSKRRGKIFVLGEAPLSDTSVVSQATPVSLASDAHVATRDQAVLEQVLSNQATTSEPSGHGGGTMPIYGSLDDDAEMPDVPAPRKKPKAFESAPKEGTHAALVYRFERGLSRLSLPARFNRGILHSALKSLRDDGLTNAEIGVLIDTFFARREQDIRAKRGEHDLAAMFRHSLPQLQVLAKEQVENVRSGRESSLDRGRAASQAKMERLLAQRKRASGE
jgi:DNA-binding transcriptional ArsR family regulator